MWLCFYFLVLVPCGQRIETVQPLPFKMHYRGLPGSKNCLQLLYSSDADGCSACGHQMQTHFIPLGNKPNKVKGFRLGIEDKWFPYNLFLEQSLERTSWEVLFWILLQIFSHPNTNQVRLTLLPRSDEIGYIQGGMAIDCCKYSKPAGSSMLPLSFNIAIWLICKLFHLRKSYIFFLAYFSHF